MTKKFWNEWQKRLGETKAICRWVYYDNGCQRFQTHRMVGQDIPNRFLSFDFSGDTVRVEYEVKDLTLSGSYHFENRSIVLNRKDIVTIKFNQYGKTSYQDLRKH